MVPSNAEYIVCTKIDNGERVNAVLGFTLMQMPSSMVLLLSSGQVISLKLVIDPKLLSSPLTTNSYLNNGLSGEEDNNKLKSPLDTLLNTSFVDHIKNILKRDVTQPILSTDHNATPSAQDCYELLTQSIEVLRSQYMKKHEIVRAQFAKRIHTIQLCKEQQKRDIADLEQERDTISDKAHKLADRYEELSEKQELLTKRYISKIYMILNWKY